MSIIRIYKTDRRKDPRPHYLRVQEKLEHKIHSICEMYKDGVSLRKIAAVHKVSHESIRQLLTNHKIFREYHHKQLAVGQKRVSKDGYIHIYVGLGVIGATKGGWILEHRLVMQRQLGRPLQSWEIVHHKDRNKANNEPDNLEVTTISDHATCRNCPYYTYYLRATGKELFDPLDKSLCP